MATCSTNQWVSTSPYVRLTVTEQSSSAIAVTFNWVLEYISSKAISANDLRSYTVKIDGDVIKKGTYNINGVSGTQTIASGTTTVPKTTSARSVGFSVSFAFNLNWSGSFAGTISASGSYAIPARLSYTVKYNANGGSGAPVSQTKWYGTDLTISNTKPTRTGYTFQGWATSSTGSVAYASGSKYAANENIILYAVWKTMTYTIKFNANGGSGAPANQNKLYGVGLIIPDTIPTRSGYTFKGWGVSSSSTTAKYTPGSTYTANTAATLYAVWERSYKPPVISNASVKRCDGTGTLDDSGTFAKISFNWTSSVSLTSITTEWRLSTESTWHVDANSSGPSSGTGGTVSLIAGDEGTFDTEKTYIFRITVSDSVGSSQILKTMTGSLYVIDFLAGGLGAAFGKPAERDGLDINWHTILRNAKAIYGVTADGQFLQMLVMDSNNSTRIGGGGYANSIGNTQLDGNIINIRSKNSINLSTANNGKVYINGCPIAINNVLWSGAELMTADKTISLSGAISAQNMGAIFAWSQYDGTTAKNSYWKYFIVPKEHIKSYAGTAITMSDPYLGIYKHLFVKDTTVTGSSVNNTASTKNSVAYDNNGFVLRYVVGI
jgi:uncharacterized repeat protein (TIGR02543 family)